MLDLLSKFKKYVFVFLDAVLIALAYLLTYLFVDVDFLWRYYLAMIYVAMVTYLVVFLIFGIYNGIIRFSSIKEYGNCLFACAVSGILLCAERHVFPFLGPMRQQMLAAVFAAFICVGVRVFLRIVLGRITRRRNSAPQLKRLLVIGAGQAGHRVIREFQVAIPMQYNIVGLIDDKKGKIGCRVSGVKVLGDRYKIAEICREEKVDVILFAIPSATVEEKTELLNICNETKCQVRVLPGIDEMLVSDRLTDHIRQPEVTDLLERDPVKLNNEAIGDLLCGRVVLVTGGGGSIGSELCRQIAKFRPKTLLILDIYENNAYDIQNELRLHFPELDQRVIIASVRERGRLEEVFEEYRPAIVFHAAAHKHVPLMEDNPQEAIKNNVFGTLNVAECADVYQAEKFVLISTDKAVNPTNIMGATKRICEMIIQNLDRTSRTEFAAVRFGNVLGSNGSVLPLFKKQIAEGGPITVTHKEITRFFMTIPEAAQLVLQAASYASGGEIFVLDMGEPVKIYDLAEKLIRLSGFVPGKDIAIEVIGLRPGEKLYEELMMEEEGLQATQNEKIFITKPVDFAAETLASDLAKLQDVVRQQDRTAIKAAVAELVATYSPDYGPSESSAEVIIQPAVQMAETL